MQHTKHERYEDAMREWSHHLNKMKKPFFLRFAHEFNGHWYEYGDTFRDGKESAERYQDLWTRAHALIHLPNRTRWVLAPTFDPFLLKSLTPANFLSKEPLYDIFAPTLVDLSGSEPLAPSAYNMPLKVWDAIIEASGTPNLTKRAWSEVALARDDPDVRADSYVSVIREAVRVGMEHVVFFSEDKVEAVWGDDSSLGYKHYAVFDTKLGTGKFVSPSSGETFEVVDGFPERVREICK